MKLLFREFYKATIRLQFSLLYFPNKKMRLCYVKGTKFDPMMKKKVGWFLEKKELRNPNIFATIVQMTRFMLDSASDIWLRKLPAVCVGKQHMISSGSPPSHNGPRCKAAYWFMGYSIQNYPNSEGRKAFPNTLTMSVFQKGEKALVVQRGCCSSSVID